MNFDRDVLEIFIEFDKKKAGLDAAWAISCEIQRLPREHWPQLAALLICAGMNAKIFDEARDALKKGTA